MSHIKERIRCVALSLTLTSLVFFNYSPFPTCICFRLKNAYFSSTVLAYRQHVNDDFENAVSVIVFAVCTATIVSCFNIILQWSFLEFLMLYFTQFATSSQAAQRTIASVGNRMRASLFMCVSRKTRPQQCSIHKVWNSVTWPRFTPCFTTSLVRARPAGHT